MPHPKRKISKTRRDKRRTHYTASEFALTTCPTTGVAHRRHRGHVHEGTLYYKGNPVQKDF